MVCTALELLHEHSKSACMLAWALYTCIHCSQHWVQAESKSPAANIALHLNYDGYFCKGTLFQLKVAFYKIP